MPGSSSAPAPAPSRNDKTQNAISSPSSAQAHLDCSEDSGKIGQLQDAAFVFTADLNGVITGCNQAVDRYGYGPKDRGLLYRRRVEVIRLRGDRFRTARRSIRNWSALP